MVGLYKTVNLNWYSGKTTDIFNNYNMYDALLDGFGSDFIPVDLYYLGIDMQFRASGIKNIRTMLYEYMRNGGSTKIPSNVIININTYQMALDYPNNNFMKALSEFTFKYDNSTNIIQCTQEGNYAEDPNRTKVINKIFGLKHEDVDKYLLENGYIYEAIRDYQNYGTLIEFPKNYKDPFKIIKIDMYDIKNTEHDIIIKFTLDKIGPLGRVCTLECVMRDLGGYQLRKITHYITIADEIYSITWDRRNDSGNLTIPQTTFAYIKIIYDTNKIVEHTEQIE